MPYQTPLGVTYDCGDFAEEHGRRAQARRRRGLRRPPRGVQARAAGCAASASSTPSSARPARQPEFAEIRFAPSGTRDVSDGQQEPGPGPRDHVQADPARAARPRSRATSRYIDGDTDRVGFGMGTMGSRSTVIGGTALWMAADKVIAKGKKIAAKLLEAAEARHRLRRRPLRRGRDRPRRSTLKEVARAAFQPAAAARPASSPACTRRGRSRRSRTRGPTAATSARWRSIPTPASSTLVPLRGRRRRRHRDQSRSRSRARSTAAWPRGWARR